MPNYLLLPAPIVAVIVYTALDIAATLAVAKTGAAR